MQILVHHDGQQLGPFAPSEVQAAVEAGTLSVNDLAWVEGTPNWVPLGSILGGTMPMGLTPYGMRPDLRPTSSLAIASLVLGLLTFTCHFFTAIPGVICGHMARAEIRRSMGTMKGEGMALAGLILGYFWAAVIGVILLVVIIVPLFIAGASLPEVMRTKSLHETSSVLTCQSHAGLIVSACSRYAAEHDGTYPAALEELVPLYISDRSKLACSLAGEGVEIGFDYFGANQKDLPPGMVLIASKGTDHSGQRIIGLVNGKTRLEKLELGN